MTHTPPPVNAGSFWDEPTHRPPIGKLEVGDSITGKVERLALESSMFDRSKMQLTYTLDGQQRWATGRLWTALFKARVEEGDTVTIERLADEEKVGPGGHPITNWRVIKHEGDQAAVPQQRAPLDGQPFEW